MIQGIQYQTQSRLLFNLKFQLCQENQTQVPSFALSIFFSMLFHLVLTTTLWDGYYH